MNFPPLCTNKFVGAGSKNWILQERFFSKASLNIIRKLTQWHCASCFPYRYQCDENRQVGQYSSWPCDSEAWRRGSRQKFLHFYSCISLKGFILGRFYTCDKQVLWESVGALFPRDNSPGLRRQVAQFGRSWSSGKMLAIQTRGFMFKLVRMRSFFTSRAASKQSIVAAATEWYWMGFMRMFSLEVVAYFLN